MFLFCLIVGFAGLILMALPGIHHHSGIGVHGGHHLGSHPGVHGAVTVHSSGAHPSNGAHIDASGGDATQASGFQLTSLIPSPRAIFSVLALFGAFAIALESAFKLSVPITSVAAIVPAILIETLAVRPLWNWMFSFQGKPTTPLEAMILKEAKAVTPFSNGKGVVAINHDGRVLQFSASLPEHQSKMPVNVGDRLCIDDVDAARQRVSVSIKTEIDPTELK